MNKWYAVQKDSNDDWDYGSHFLEIALEKLENQGCGLIAVINEETGCCEDEIYFDDIFWNY